MRNLSATSTEMLRLTSSQKIRQRRRRSSTRSEQPLKWSTLSHILSACQSKRWAQQESTVSHGTCSLLTCSLPRGKGIRNIFGISGYGLWCDACHDPPQDGFQSLALSYLTTWDYSFQRFHNIWCYPLKPAIPGNKIKIIIYTSCSKLWHCRVGKGFGGWWRPERKTRISLASAWSIGRLKNSLGFIFGPNHCCSTINSTCHVLSSTGLADILFWQLRVYNDSCGHLMLLINQYQRMKYKTYAPSIVGIVSAGLRNESAESHCCYHKCNLAPASSCYHGFTMSNPYIMSFLASCNGWSWGTSAFTIPPVMASMPTLVISYKGDRYSWYTLFKRSPNKCVICLILWHQSHCTSKGSHVLFCCRDISLFSFRGRAWPMLPQVSPCTSFSVWQMCAMRVKKRNVHVRASCCFALAWKQEGSQQSLGVAGNALERFRFKGYLWSYYFVSVSESILGFFSKGRPSAKSLCAFFFGHRTVLRVTIPVVSVREDLLPKKKILSEFLWIWYDKLWKGYQYNALWWHGS